MNWYELRITERELVVIREALQFYQTKRVPMCLSGPEPATLLHKEMARDLDWRLMGAHHVT